MQLSLFNNPQGSQLMMLLLLLLLLPRRGAAVKFQGSQGSGVPPVRQLQQVHRYVDSAARCTGDHECTAQCSKLQRLSALPATLHLSLKRFYLLALGQACRPAARSAWHGVFQGTYLTVT
jgi:hypothetical protein